MNKKKKQVLKKHRKNRNRIKSLRQNSIANKSENINVSSDIKKPAAKKPERKRKFDKAFLVKQKELLLKERESYLGSAATLEAEAVLTPLRRADITVASSVIAHHSFGS